MALIFAQDFDMAGRCRVLSATIGATADFISSCDYDSLYRLSKMAPRGTSGKAVAEIRVDFAFLADGQF